MNERYLQTLAASYARHGKALTNYTFVFPNRRAGLFFRKYLGQALTQPLLSPAVMTIDECFHELSRLSLADNLSMLVRLYHIYSQHCPSAEPFGQFLRWGQMMLSDFSEIDNHLVDNVPELFTTVRDLKEIDYKFTYLSDTQKDAIRRFWGDVFADIEHGQKDAHRHFLNTWELLLPCYNELRQLLRQEGLAYEGMIHREVIEHFDELSDEQLRCHYVFIGFNALTRSEERLMLLLKQQGRAELCFDYNHPFLRDPDNRASLFLQHNQSLFGFTLPDTSAVDCHIPEMSLITIPSDVGEAGQVYRLLDELSGTDAAADWTRTAVVLPDEKMLLPLLTHIPQQIPTVNITMGYPVRATRPFIPVMQEPNDNETPRQALERLRQTWETETDDTTEATQCLLAVLNRMEDVLLSNDKYAPTLGIRDFYYVLRMLTEELTIPYVGEPLSGLQVMGVLETRALDFDNLIIMGFNDDIYPGNSRGNSYIPYTLRRGFGMPVPERQDAIFAYNFYRMLSHAQRVWFISNSQADEQHSGEVSRYMQQLLYQYNLQVPQQTVVLGTLDNTDNDPPLVVAEPIKEDDTLFLSPSALNTFLRCEQKYCYEHVFHLREEENDDNEVDERTLGTAFHATVQHLYEAEQKEVTPEVIQRIRQRFDNEWETLPDLDPIRKDPIAVEVVRCYVQRLLDMDLQQGSFTRLGLEQKVQHSWQEDGQKILLKGSIDRIDRKDGIVRLIDYKTGHAELKYKDLEKAFTSDTYPYVLQTMVYCLLYRHNDLQTSQDTTSPIAPFIFPMRAISDTENFTGNVHPESQKTGIAVFDEQTEQAVINHLKTLVRRIIEARKSATYSKTTDARKCETCSFATLCKR